MKINWFTVIAQVINFVLLVWLLRKFLYKPILDAVKEREKKIVDQLREADDKKTSSQKQEEDFRKQQQDFNQQKQTLMDQAVSDANAEKQKMLDNARVEANALRERMEKASRESQEADHVERTEKTQRRVFDITRKALADIASVSLEEQSAAKFIQRFSALRDEEKKQFVDAFKSNANTILVRSAFELPPKQQGEISNAVDEVLHTNVQLQFRTAPEIISGIELSTNGYKLAWSFTEYLNTLDKNISESLKEKANPVPEKN
ncbi:MAG: F0F1 ATP synthase subunit B [Chryseolinea sp.]